MVQEAHRLGKKVVTHARGREAVLYAARAGVDLIFHAYYLDDECIGEMLKIGQRHRPDADVPAQHRRLHAAARAGRTKGRIDDTQEEFEIACENLRKAHKAGVPMLTGTDSGFAVTPYGEWHARELEIFVDASRLHAGRGAARHDRGHRPLHGGGHKIGVLEKGRAADFIAVEGSPLQTTAILQDKSRIRAVYIDGKPMQNPEPRLRPAQGHRLCLDELERHLHPGAGRGDSRSATRGGMINSVRTLEHTNRPGEKPMSRAIRPQSVVTFALAAALSVACGIAGSSLRPRRRSRCASTG